MALGPIMLLFAFIPWAIGAFVTWKFYEVLSGICQELAGIKMAIVKHGNPPS